MRVLGVGGLSSGVGKTTLICRLLSVLPGWGTLKTSIPHKNSRHAPSEGFDLIEDAAGLRRARSDTTRFAASGSARVLWLRSAPGALTEGIESALQRFADLPGVVVEGNSFAVHRKPDAFVLLARAGLRDVKRSTSLVAPTADWLALNVPGGTDDPAEVAWLRRALEVPESAPVIVLDSESEANSGTVRLCDEVRAWSRR
jgi:molybdopterin-guanine dinucleotide biosynthesis protein